LIERKKLLTCSWLTSEGVGGMVIGVVVLEVDEEKEDMNCCTAWLVLSLSSFIGFEELFGIGDVCFWFPGVFCFRISFSVNQKFLYPIFISGVDYVFNFPFFFSCDDLQ